MRFRITNEAIDRLGLNPKTANREFDGPSIREGLMGGFPRNALKYAKSALKVDRIEQLDVADSRLCYYLLAIKAVDHAVLPFSRIDELALADFLLVKHEVTSLDQDGDCGECSQAIGNLSVHIPSDGPIPPTQAPDDQGTTGTATG